MNNLGSSDDRDRDPERTPRSGRNTFFDYYHQQPTPDTANSSPQEEKTSKPRSIFTLSGSFTSKRSSDSNNKKSKELLNIVSEVNSLSLSSSSTGREHNADDSNKDKSTECRMSMNLPVKADCQPSPRLFHSKSMPSSKTEESSILTPPSTPPDSKQVDSDGGVKRQRHNSLENLHRPKNHRSSTKSSKKRRPKEMDCDSISSCSSRTRSDTSAMTRYNVHNKALNNYDEKRNLASRAAAAFAMGAVRRLSSQVAQLQGEKLIKDRESAARLILRGLLLNSWRQCRNQNDKLMKENSAHLRTIENMCLQLRVIRQMHREEKEKSQSRSVQVSSMAMQMTKMKDERDKIQTELEKVENELNNCQVYVESLGNTNADLQQQKNKLQKSIALVEKEKQEEMKKVTRLEMEQIRLEDKVTHAKQQHEDEIRQRVRWQEEARGKDSEIYTLKNDLDSKEKQINKIQNSYLEVKQEADLQQHAKQKLQKEKLKLNDQLASATETIKKLQEKLTASEELVKNQTLATEEARSIIKQRETAIREARDNLCLYMSEGIEKRRRWANAFHYLVFPLDIFRVILDLPQESTYTVDLAKISNTDY